MSEVLAESHSLLQIRAGFINVAIKYKMIKPRQLRLPAQ